MNIILLLLTLLVSGCAVNTEGKVGSLKTVEKVDIERYAGRWYQIAYFPVRFQPGNCDVVTADYGINKKGDVTVHNTCWEDYENQIVQTDIKGTAKIASPQNTKLKVKFFWWLPIRANYWIIDIDEKDYSYAVVSEPSRKYLWILARKPSMEKELYTEIVTRVKDKGLDTNRIVITAPITE